VRIFKRKSTEYFKAKKVSANFDSLIDLMFYLVTEKKTFEKCMYGVGKAKKVKNKLSGERVQMNILLP
jgi:hypothetical protein